MAAANVECAPAGSDRSRRPGTVIAIEGIVFQCDADDRISGFFIRPLQEISQRIRGQTRADLDAPQAEHWQDAY